MRSSWAVVRPPRPPSSVPVLAGALAFVIANAIALFAAAPVRAQERAPAAGQPTPGPAAPDGKRDVLQACSDAFDAAQQSRDDGKYQRAHQQFLACQRDACPAAIRSDCAEALDALDASAPSIVPSASDARGHDLVAVTVTLDGQPFSERLDGKPIVVDPGEHVLRFEAPGLVPAEQRIVVRVGEKNRVVPVQLADVPSANPTTRPVTHVEPRRTSAVPLATWVAGGTGIVGFGVAAFLGLSAQSDVSTLRQTCAANAAHPACAPSQVDPIRTKLVVSDVTFGVGVVGAAAATYFYLTRPFVPVAPAAVVGGLGPRAAGVTVDVASLPGGGLATVAGRF